MTREVRNSLVLLTCTAGFGFLIRFTNLRIVQQLESILNEFKNKKIELSKAKHRYRNLIDTMNEGLVEVDENWNITYTNNAFARMTGVKLNQIIGKCFHDFVAKSHKKLASSEHQNRLSGKTHRYELELLLQDGQTISIMCSPQPRYDLKGKYLGGLAVIADISHIKKNEKEREMLIAELQEKLDEIQTLKGLLPICANCKKIRDDNGYWNNLESYIEKYSDAFFSHSICPDCSDKIYGKENWYIESKKRKDEKF
ncbi:MAG: PAS domain S-box protein [archaeon]|nr:PAS domain S-box protein [archaeon]